MEYVTLMAKRQGKGDRGPTGFFACTRWVLQFSEISVASVADRCLLARVAV